MLTLIKQFRSPQTIVNELPAMAVAWLIAEFFYKFHSFTLECAGFLATWLILSAAISFALPSFRDKSMVSSIRP